LPFSQTILSVSGEVGDRQADVRGEGSHEEIHPLARDQFLGDPHRVTGGAAIVPGQQLDLAAGGVDLLDCELHALLVGLEEGGEDLVTVQLADLERLAKDRRNDEI
jgi:hypothetical protein